RPDCVLGVSIGKSKITPLEEATADYLKSFELVYSVADYVAVNISSPNTPRLRELQQGEQLEQLLRALQSRNQELAERVSGRGVLPILVKLAPELSEEELRAIVDVAQRNNVAGLIATNTTTARDGLRTPATKVETFGAGGLS